MNPMVRISAFMIIFLALPFLGKSQQDVIAPLFGVENAAQPTVNSYNQVTGESYFISSAGALDIFNNNYAIDYNNNRIFFSKLDTPLNGTTIVSFNVPEFFDQGFNAPSSLASGQAIYSDFTYHHQSDTIYATDNQFLYAIGPTNGIVGNVITISSTNFFGTNEVSMASDIENIYIAGRLSGLAEVVMFTVQVQGFQVIDIDTFSNFSNLQLIAHPNLNSLFGLAESITGEHRVVRYEPNNNIFEVMGTLPPCANCSYSKNAMAIDIENLELIYTKNDAGNFTLETFSIIGDSLVRSAPLSSFVSNLYYDKAMADIVFPGDANHDKIVNMDDLLPIGVKYNDLVNPRINPTTAWVGQFAQSNNDTLIDGLDVKHVDCNGDGQINSIDAQAIIENFNSIHNSEKKADDDCEYQLRIVLPDSTFEDRETAFGIALGEPTQPVDDVYGLSFVIDYPQNFVANNAVVLEDVNSWFGIENTDLISLKLNETNLGSLHVGITGINKLNRSGGGILTYGRWTMEDEVIPIANGVDTLVFRIRDVKIINKDEEILDACGSAATTLVYDKTVGLNKVLESKIEVYPTPAQNQVNINITDDVKVTHMQLHDTKGSLVRRYTFQNQILLDELESGIYFLTLNTNQGISRKKIVVQ